MSPEKRASWARRRRMLDLAIPATLTLLAEPVLGLVDTAIAGRLGRVELGALGLALSLLGAVTLVFNFLVFGTTTAVARALGSGDPDSAGRTVAHSALVAGAIGLVSASILGFAAPLLVRGVGAIDALADPAVAYLRIRTVGIPFMFLGFVGHGAFRGAGDTRRPLGVAVAANLVNLGLNVLLVFEFGWGLQGIAVATVVAEIIIASWLGLTIRSNLGLPITGHGLPNRTQTAELISVSRDLLLRTVGLVGGWTAITAAAARTDPSIAAAHQIIWQVYMFLGFLLDGLAVSIQTMIATALGASDSSEVRDTVNDGLRWSVGAGLVIGVLLLVAQRPIVGLFTSDPAVFAEVAKAWWLPAMTMALPALVFALDGILMGAADFGFIRRWTVTGGVLGGILAQVGVGLGGGLLWLWICYEVVMLFRGIPLLIRTRSNRWLSWESD